MAHAYNPSYSGVRDQEDHRAKPAQANSSWDPTWKMHNTKQGWWSDSSGRMLACLAKYETLSSNPSTLKKKKGTKELKSDFLIRVSKVFLL
jgi:hypothetical protein